MNFIDCNDVYTLKLISEFGIKSDVLLKTELQLVESSLCSYKDIYEEKICAGGFNKLHTCRGK